MSDLIRRRDAVSRMSELLMMELQGQRLPTWNEVYQAMNDIPSAEPDQKWIPFTKRELTTEEKEEHPEWDYIMNCELPDDGEEILVSNGKFVWSDTFINDGDGCYLDGDTELDGCAWMPLPEPYRGE